MLSRMTILLCLLLSSSILFSQEVELTPEQEEALITMAYEMGRAPFMKSTYAYKLKEVDEKDLFVKSKNTSALRTNALNYLVTNAKIVQEIKFSKPSVRLESRFPNGFEEEDILSATEIEFVNADVKDESGKSIKISPFGGSNMFGNQFKYSVDNPEENYNYVTFNMTSTPQYGQQIDGMLSGKMTYVAKFLTDYKVIKLTSADVGKEFELNGNRFKVIDIYDNKLILDCLSGKPDDFVFKLKYFNLEKGGKQLRVGLDFQEKKERGIDSMNTKIASSALMNVSKSSYELFRNNPDMTKEEFKILGKKSEKNAKKKHRKYLLITSLAPIDGEFLIYEEVYDIQKEFTIKL